MVDVVVEQIKARILSGHLARGDRLPPELELATRLGVGRNAVREALSTLKAQGWVTRSKKGTEVSASERDLLLGPISDVAQLQRLTMRELFEARKLLEGEVAALAAERATPGELEEIRGEAARINVPGLSDEEFTEANVSFHMTIARGGHNRLLLAILEAVRHMTTRSVRAGAQLKKVRDASVIAHAALAEAIASRDVVAARTAMLRHLEEVEAGHLASSSADSLVFGDAADQREPL